MFHSNNCNQTLIHKKLSFAVLVVARTVEFHNLIDGEDDSNRSAIAALVKILSEAKTLRHFIASRKRFIGVLKDVASDYENAVDEAFDVSDRTVATGLSNVNGSKPFPTKARVTEITLHLEQVGNDELKHFLKYFDHWIYKSRRIVRSNSGTVSSLTTNSAERRELLTIVDVYTGRVEENIKPDTNTV